MAVRKGILAILAWGMTCGLQASTAQDANTPAGAVDSNAVRAKAVDRPILLQQIRQSHDRQRALFRNMRFKAVHTKKNHKPGNEEPVLSILEEMEIDKEGRYLIRSQTIIPPGAEGNREAQKVTRQFSFDGQRYWEKYEPDHGFVSTVTGANLAEFQSYLAIRSLMPHLFWVGFQEALSGPNDPILMELPDGLCVMVVNRQAPFNSYRAVFDPKKGFMATQIEFLDELGQTIHEYRMEYRQTTEGFWYPVHGIDGGSDIEITDFHLNVPDFRCQVEIPKGMEVWDYTKDSQRPEVSRYGEARKSFDQIVQSHGRFVAGTVVDEKGQPVAGVPVSISCYGTRESDGQLEWHFLGQELLIQVRTDDLGQFAFEVQEDGIYNLLLSNKDYAAVIAYEVPVGTEDLKVILPERGTVSGHVVRIKEGRKVPVAGIPVTIKQKDRRSDLGDDRNELVTQSDEQGGFQFKHLSTQMRAYPWKGVCARIWEVRSRDVLQIIAFEDGNTVANVELTLLPKPSEIPPLMGRPLPGFDGIRIDWLEDQAMDQPLLICFFDMQYQPSRNTMLGLSLKTAALQEKGVCIVGVQASGTDPNELDGWLRKIRVGFPVGSIESQDAEVRYTWGVRSLPWLILADKAHVVRAEGFAIGELDAGVAGLPADRTR